MDEKPQDLGLAGEHCEACRPDSPRLSDPEVADLVARLDGWAVVAPGGVPRLEKVFAFRDFRSALAFADRVGAAADAEGHHPALLVEWGRVTVQWWTHALAGLHRNDFIMASRTDGLVP